jgi:hypothetical protein
MREPGKPIVRRPRGRPPGSRMDSGKRTLRQTRNLALMAASAARAVIAYHLPREEMRKLLLAKLETAEANGADVWAIRDSLQMLDTLDAMDAALGEVREERRVTQKEALRKTRKIRGLEDADHKKAMKILRDGRDN